MELWERAAALALLDELHRAAAREGRVALVAGEAGLGKTALVSEFARRSAARGPVVWGRCDRLLTPRALGPLHDIGRDVGGALADRLAAGAGQEEIFRASLEVFAGGMRRVRVVVVEDAHWADGATLDWLTFLGRRIAALPALLVVTYRDDEIGPEHPLRGALSALPAAVTRRVPLAPLSAACVRAQAGRAGRDADLVHRLAGGNPLLVSELLKTEGAVVPATVQDLILDRLRTVPPAARDLARFVSVVPTRAEAALLAGAADLVDACVDAGILVPAGDGVSFRHELLRGAVEESLSPTRRADLHRRVLAVLARTPGVDAGRLVHHARRSGDADAVLRHGQVAGAAAARQGAHREAAEHYRAAAAYADRLPPAERAALLEAYAVEAYRAGRAEDGIGALRVAVGVREALGQPEAAGDDLRLISRLAWWSGRAPEAWQAAADAVAVLAAAPPGRPLAMAWSNQSQLHMLARDHAAAIEWGERALALADELGDVATAVHATVNVQTARMHDGHPDAAAALEAAHERARAHRLLDDAARALVNLASTLAELARYTDAAPATERALAYVTGQDLDGYVQYLLGVRATVRFAALDWAGALADAQESLDRPVKAGVAVVPALVVRGRIQAARGDAAARSTLDEADRQAARTGEVQWAGPVAAARAEHLLWCGDDVGAAAEARRGLDLAHAAGDELHRAELTYRWWRATGEGDPDAAAALPYGELIGGDWRGAAAAWDRRGGAYQRIEVLAEGDRAAAVEALRTLDGLGAAAAAAHLRGRLRARGLTGLPRGPRPATAAHDAGLTPRQAQVLDLLAEGLSNAEIAGRLSLSAKTVDHHVSAVLSRLGVASRGQAAALVRRRHPPAGQGGPAARGGAPHSGR